MSQQINLILPDLQPRFDWLALPLVLGASAACVLLVVALALSGAAKVQDLAVREAMLKGNLKNLQQKSVDLGGALAARQGDASLPERIESARLAVEQRQEALDNLKRGGGRAESRFAETMRGFSRQVTEGVWLTGFEIGDKDMEIKGRLTAPSLLPGYIARLNSEAAFAGQQFEALEMTPPLVERALQAAGVPLPVVPRDLPPYMEFVLRSNAPAKKGAAR